MNKIKYQFELIQAIRNFFNREGFMDVMVPPIVENPGMETHIHPFQIYSSHKKKTYPQYLQTSPEFHMKGLLAKGKDLNNIFTISYAFRDEPSSPIHRSQFLMLEWYRKSAHYEKIMDDIEALIKFTQNHFGKNAITDFPRVTVQEIFQEFLKIDILDFLNKDELKNLIRSDFKDVPLPEADCAWDDYFFLLFLNKIEPHFKNYPYLLLKEFPAPLAALSTLKSQDKRVCERFEVYLSGVELCNCFNELTDFGELEKRFQEQAIAKKHLYDYELPWPKDFMKTMKEGYPPSAGIALGVERLLMSLTKTEDLFFDSLI